MLDTKLGVYHFTSQRNIDVALRLEMPLLGSSCKMERIYSWRKIAPV